MAIVFGVKTINPKVFNPRFFKALRVAVDDVNGQFAITITHPNGLTKKQAETLRKEVAEINHWRRIPLSEPW